ncbi:MAG TPA: PocR ligand-binding domain-containing protein [Candidatus Ozemobacteraceae bacterium]|nr:PocR ligand-binding domain-containing protein [Candidatus Ozemobacteraceae bacterium]
MSTHTRDLNVNQTVTFATGQIPALLKKFESFYGVPLSLRSTTGETVVKTDYFYGPCSMIRGTDRGRQRCKRSYQNVEERLLRRKVPFVNICYAGFLVFAIPLEFRGEMVGTLLGSQILPMDLHSRSDFVMHFEHTIMALGLHDHETFYKSFACVRSFRPDFERVALLNYLDQIGKHFITMAFTGKTWAEAYREIQHDMPGTFALNMINSI